MLCERFGWTLEYADSLDAGEAWELINILNNADKAWADEARKAHRQKMRKGR